MIISGAQRESPEHIIGQFLVARNEWIADLAGGLRNLNLRGMAASFASDLTDITAVRGNPGQCCVIGAGASDSWITFPLGVVVSDLVLDGRPLVNTWVNVLMYGHCDRIITDSATSVLSTDHLLYTPLQSGMVAGMSFTQYSASRQISGLAALYVSGGAETVFLNLAGAATGAPPTPPSSEWIVSPGVNSSAPISGEGAYASATAMIGYHYLGDSPVLVTEAPQITGGPPHYQVKGFVKCLGMNGIG